MECEAWGIFKNVCKMPCVSPREGRFFFSSSFKRITVLKAYQTPRKSHGPKDRLFLAF